MTIKCINVEVQEWIKDEVFEMPALKTSDSCAEFCDTYDNFVSQYQDGDKIFTFDNDGWIHMAGRSGYCIVRGEKVIASLLTFLN